MKEIEESTELQLQFEKRGGLLPVAVQDAETGEILMIATVNRDALELTLQKGKAAFWSRSRNELWVKGETSGNELHIKEILVDCDQDALVYKVDLHGDGACHTKNESGEHRTSCFYRSIDLNKKTLSFHNE
jgi:phosphoribosyl-AMP cyclohydrolase